MKRRTFLLLGESGHVRDRMERGLAEMYTAPRIIVADGPDDVVPLAGNRAIDCVIVIPPSRGERWTALVGAILRAKPDLHRVPFMVFDGSRGRPWRPK